MVLLIPGAPVSRRTAALSFAGVKRHSLTLSTGSTEALVPAGEGIAFPFGTLETFVTYGATAT